MIRKLRRKFTVAALGSMALVLLLILGTVNVVNYKNVVQEADGMLQMLADNNGTFPDQKPGQEQAGNADNGEPPQDQPEKGLENERINELGRELGKFRNTSAETPFETRYFSVLLDANGAVVSTDVSKIAAVDEETAQEYAKDLLEKQKEKGFVSVYRYYVKTLEEETMVLFVDCGRSLSTCRMFLFASIGITFAGLLAVFVLLLILSGRIVRPYAESYEKQKRFITDAGHEIKTPLTIIDADLAVLEMELDQEEPNEWIADIQKQTERLKDLTNDLIYLSKMEEGTIQKNQRSEFPISEVVGELVQSFQNLALANGKTVVSDIEPVLTFYGDVKGIQKLTGILLDNAVKYATEGSTIELQLKKQGKGIRLSVSNQTEHMDQNQVRRMFDRFYRGDESRSTKTGGYGIGLSIAKAVTEAHKGKIKASLSGEGVLTVAVIL